MGEQSATQGWVYAVTNKALPGLVKVGFTTRDDINKRLREFDQAGLPYPYEVAYKVWVPEPQKLERRVHQSLTIERENKEWFRCSVERAQEAIDHLAPTHTELLQKPGMAPEPNPVSDSGWSGYSKEPNARFEVDDERERREPTRAEENGVAFWGVSVVTVILVILVVVWWNIALPLLAALESSYFLMVLLGLVGLTLKSVLWVLQYVGSKMERYRQHGTLPY